MLRTPSWGLMLLLAGCGCRRGCAPEAAVEAAVTAPVSVAVPIAALSRAPWRTETVAELFCINEAVSVPQRLVRSGTLQPVDIAVMLEDDARLAVSVGARMVRANSANYPYVSWYEWQQRPRAQDRTDRYLALVQQAGLEPLVMIGPWPGNQTGNYTQRYVPQDMAAYTAWVQQVVERYDGDGVDDAPGLLRPVRFWEVDNEPDLHNRIPPKGAKRQVDPSTFETPSEYAQVLLATATAVRAAFPDAVVLNAGTFDTGRDSGRAYLDEVFAVPGALDAIDGLSIHAYFQEPTPERYLAALDNAQAVAAGRPVFITETGAPSELDGRSYVDENYHARMLVFVYGEALARGVERVCWHTLADPPAGRSGPGPGGGFSSHSLHRTTGRPPQQQREPKLAAAVYRRLVDLVGDVPVTSVEPVRIAGGRGVRVGGAGWLVYEGQDVVLPIDSGVVIDLLSGDETPWAGSVSAPALVRPATEG